MHRIKALHSCLFRKRIELHAIKSKFPTISSLTRKKGSIALQAVGSEGETLPDNVGIPLGENFGGATYFMLETHYDNPAMHQDLIDNSGIRIYYTDQIREHDTGMLLVGTEVNFLHLVPPLQNEFTTVGRCMTHCTRKVHSVSFVLICPQCGIASCFQGLTEGVTILNGILHSHLAGRKMRLRHVRGGKELPTILEDNNYDFNYQASRRPANKTVVLPGDELLLECQYNTAKRTKPTFGGNDIAAHAGLCSYVLVKQFNLR